MMMTPTHNPTPEDKPRRVSARSSAARSRVDHKKPKISATERWVLISKNVYSRAQRRGFVGGDPFQDVAEAIKEIDDEYVTDIKGLLSLTDPAELAEQFRHLFAGYGLEKRSLDQLLAMHHDTLEKLAESNRAFINGAAERTVSRVALLRHAADEAMDALRSMARTAGHIKEHAYLPGQPAESAFVNVLSRLSAMASSIGELVENGRSARAEETDRAQQLENIHAGVVKAFNRMSAVDLAQHPIAALKGISQATGERFESACGISSIGEMANSDLFKQADGIVTLADAERSGEHGALTKLAEGSVRGLDGITSREIAALRDLFRIETIRDLAENKFFRLARSIAALADLES